MNKNYATFGKTKFELLTSFASFNETHNTQVAEHKVLRGRPKLQIMNKDLRTLEVSAKLYSELGGDKVYQDLLNSMHKPEMLMFGNGDYWGYWILENLSTNVIFQTADGRTLGREISLKFIEFRGKIPKHKNTPAVTKISPLESINYIPVNENEQKKQVAFRKSVVSFNGVSKALSGIDNLLQGIKAVASNPAKIAEFLPALTNFAQSLNLSIAEGKEASQIFAEFDEKNALIGKINANNHQVQMLADKTTRINNAKSIRLLEAEMEKAQKTNTDAEALMEKQIALFYSRKQKKVA